MTAISRLNTTISDHTMVTNFIGVCLLVSGAIVGAVAISQSGDLAKSTIGNLKPSTTSVQKQAGKAQAIPTTATITVTTANKSHLPIRGPQPDTVAQLQTAQNVTQSTEVTADTLQLSANYSQLTGVNMQHAAIVLQ